MIQTFSCDVEDCDSVFTRACELKKHKATHDDPESVFHCSQCDFITLRKQSLEIHTAIHTGEKAYQCPELVTSSPGEPPVPCDYKTNDPAALSKHRKRIHDYVPPLNRTGPKCPRSPLEKKDENASLPRRSPRGHPPPCPRPIKRRGPRMPQNPNGTASVANPSPLRNEIIDVDAMDVDADNSHGIVWNGTALVDSEDEEEMSLDMYLDPTLSAQWMAKYEQTYTTFEPYVSKSSRKPMPGGVEIDTRRDGCLCPEWMEETGVEGWGNSIAEDAEEMEVL